MELVLGIKDALLWAILAMLGAHIIPLALRPPETIRISLSDNSTAISERSAI
jgi:hypothetical protein